MSALTDINNFFRKTYRRARSRILGYPMNHEEQASRDLIANSMLGRERTIQRLLEDPDINLTKRDAGGKTALMNAARDGHIDVVRKILNDPRIATNMGTLVELVNITDIKGNSALMKASRQGHSKIVNLLLDNSADVNMQHRSEDRMTALMYATLNSHLIIVKQLLSVGADVQLVNNNNDNALMLSLILKNAATWFDNVLQKELTYKFEIAKLLLEHETSVRVVNKSGKNVLLLLANWKDPRTTENMLLLLDLFLKYHVNVNIKQNDGYSALMLGLYNHNIPYVDRLLYVPTIDLNDRYKDGYSLLMTVTQMHLLPIAKTILRKGVNVNAVNEAGENVLMILASWTNPSLREQMIAFMDLFIQYGININAVSDRGEPALVRGILYQNIPYIQKLLSLQKLNKDIGNPKQINNQMSVHPIIINGSRFDVAKQEQIRNLLTVNSATVDEMGPLGLWKGFTRTDATFFNVVFENPMVFSTCPVCLARTEHISNCKYMSHNCKTDPLFPNNIYNERLFDMYVNNGVIMWCTWCCRIAANHRHYELSRADGPKAEPDVFSDCRDAMANRIDEKLKRINGIRREAIELNKQIGRITNKDAKYRLIQANWNGPLNFKDDIERIKRSRAFSTRNTNFPEKLQLIKPSSDTSGLAFVRPNIEYPDKHNIDLFPIVHERGTDTVTRDDVPNVVQFRHRMENGKINNHNDEYISIDDLFKTIVLNQYIFGSCWTGKSICTARIYPQELFKVIELAYNLSPEKRKEYVDILDRYEKRFNESFAKKSGGSENTEPMPMFPAIENATCSLYGHWNKMSSINRDV
jgi:ankyrin repeat protein